MFRNMNTRLQQFLVAENISQSQFADTIGVARASVSHILAGRNKPGFDFITSMIQNYPNLNLNWLMLGTGKMYKTSQVETPKTEMPQSLFSNVDPVEPVEAPIQPEKTQRETEISVQRDTPPSSTGFSASSAAPAPPLQVIDNQRKISKIMVFYDDNTFIEII